MPSGRRLVTSTLTRGSREARSRATAAGPGTRCSPPSSTSSTSRVPQSLAQHGERVAVVRLGPRPMRRRPSVVAVAETTSAAARSGASSTIQAARRGRVRAPPRPASVVLPTPPGPVSVTMRCRSSAPATAASSCSRPITAATRAPTFVRCTAGRGAGASSFGVTQHQRLELPAPRVPAARPSRGEPLRERPVCRERLVRTAPGAVVRAHQVAHQLLAQRVLVASARARRHASSRADPSSASAARPPLPQRVAHGVQPLAPRLRVASRRSRSANGRRARARARRTSRSRPAAAAAPPRRRGGQKRSASRPSGGTTSRYPAGSRTSTLGRRSGSRPARATPAASRAAPAATRRRRRAARAATPPRSAPPRTPAPRDDEQPRQQRPLDRAGRRLAIDEHRSEHAELHGATVPYGR